jgi:hypothetical protein
MRRNQFSSTALGFAVGIGVGAALGLIFARGMSSTTLLRPGCMLPSAQGRPWTTLPAS